MKFCSERCRRTKLNDDDRALEQAIVRLLEARATGNTICPSEAARVVFAEDWRVHMERTRRAARRLVARGQLELVQRGRVVDPSTARGPIRLRRPSSVA